VFQWSLPMQVTTAMARCLSQTGCIKTHDEEDAKRALIVSIGESKHRQTSKHTTIVLTRPDNTKPKQGNLNTQLNEDS